MRWRSWAIDAEEARRIGIDPTALALEIEAKIDAFNDLGCGGWWLVRVWGGLWLLGDARRVEIGGGGAVRSRRPHVKRAVGGDSGF